MTAKKNYHDINKNEDFLFKDVEDWNLIENKHFRRFSSIFNFLGWGHYGLGIFIFSLIWIGLFSIVTILEGAFFLSGNNIGWGEDYVWFFVIFSISLLFFFMKRLSDRFPILFTKTILRLINWESITHEEYNEILKKNFDFVYCKTTKSKIGQYVIFFTGMLSLAFYGIFMQIFHLPEISIWHHFTYPLGFAIWFCYTLLILTYLGPLIIWRYIAVFTATNNIIKSLSNPNRFIISPMNSDGAGGLSPLGKFTLNISNVTTIPLITIAIWFLVREPDNLIMFVSVPILVGLVLFTFFLPLNRMHDLMKTSKENELNKIGAELNEYYQQLMERIDKNEPLNNEESMKSLNVLEKIKGVYDDCEKMMTWPFDVKVLSTLIGSIILPTIIAIVPLFFP